MSEVHKSVHEMWENYLKSIGEDTESTESNYTSWYFCDNEESANKLALLAKEGTKRGTTSLYYWYEVENEVLPQIGDYSIITNWNGIAQCIIRTKKLTILPFKDVNDELAYIEGEGDKSLKYWRDAHINFYSRDMEGKGKEFTEDMKVVFEEFEVVYK